MAPIYEIEIQAGKEAEFEQSIPKDEWVKSISKKSTVEEKRERLNQQLVPLKKTVQNLFDSPYEDNFTLLLKRVLKLKDDEAISLKSSFKPYILQIFENSLNANPIKMREDGQVTEWPRGIIHPHHIEILIISCGLADGKAKTS